MPRFEVVWQRAAKRAVAEVLPEKIAFVVYEYITERLCENPRRLGKPLAKPWQGYYSARVNMFRIIYRIDDKRVIVIVADVRHRAHVYAAQLQGKRKPPPK